MSLEEFDTALKKLNLLDIHIQKASEIMIDGFDNANEFTDKWKNSLFNVPRGDHNKFLAHMYLANDVLQKCKKKGNNYNKEFTNILPSCFKLVIDKGFNCAAKLIRLCTIWENRNVLHSDVVKRLNSILTQQIKRVPSPHTPPGSPPGSPSLSPNDEYDSYSMSYNSLYTPSSAYIPSSSSISPVKRPHDSVYNRSSSGINESPIVRIKKLSADPLFIGLEPSFQSMCISADTLEASLTETKMLRSQLLRFPDGLFDDSIANDKNTLNNASNVIKNLNDSYRTTNTYRRQLIDMLQSVLIDISSGFDTIKAKLKQVDSFYQKLNDQLPSADNTGKIRKLVPKVERGESPHDSESEDDAKQEEEKVEVIPEKEQPTYKWHPSLGYVEVKKIDIDAVDEWRE